MPPRSVPAVSPASACYTDTLSTLRYAERARAIVNRPVVNSEPGPQVVMALQAEVDRLRGLLALNGVRQGWWVRGIDVMSRFDGSRKTAVLCR